MVTKLKALHTALVLGCVMSGICYGQDTGVKDLSTCAVLEDDKSRLECYDSLKKVGPQSVSSEQGPQIKTVAPIAAPVAAVVSSPTKGDFGKESIPQKSGAEATVTQHEADRLSARVKSVSQKPPGLITVELDNGQIWSETSRTGGLPPKVGDEITIKRTMFGGYLLAGTSGLALRVHRLR